MREIEINGIRVKYRDQDVPVVSEVFLEDPYHIEDIPKDSMVVDIGANIGLFSLRCAVERNCIVDAYEPVPSSFDLLQENVKINSVTTRVGRFDMAVAGYRRVSPYMQELYVPEYTASSTLYRPSDIPTKTIYVECVTLADVMKYPCNVLKIDGEGVEKEIFTEDFAQYIKRAEVILLEWHNYDGLRYKEFLENLDYSVTLTGCGLPVPAFDKSFARGMLYAKR